METQADRDIRNAKRRAHRAANKEAYRLKERELYAKNPEVKKKAVAKYKEQHPNRVAAQKAQYSANNKDKIKIANKEYYEANRQNIINNNKAYRDALPVEERRRREAQWRATESGAISVKLSKSNYKARKVAANDSTIDKEYLVTLRQEQGNVCYYCGITLSTNPYDVHLEHYIPLSKGGLHSINNVVWSCAKCNLQKNDTIPELPLTFLIHQHIKDDVK